MALSQDEQRMLAEIERRLAADDPGLASCLTTFRRPGPATVLRSPRARIVGSLFTVLLVALVSLMIYAMIPFRAHMLRHAPPTAGASASAAVSGEPSHAELSPAGVSTDGGAAASQSEAAAQNAAKHAAAPTATVQTQGKVKPATGAANP